MGSNSSTGSKELKECLENVFPIHYSKTPGTVEQDESEITDKLWSIIAEVEATASTSSKDSVNIDVSNKTMAESLVASSYDSKDDIDLTSRMETIIAAATRDKNDADNLNTSGNVSSDVSSVSAFDPFDKCGFDLPNKLYNFIAEATEEMDNEDTCFAAPGERDNQHSELSNFVTETFKKIEIENESAEKKKLELDNCEGIVAVDIGSTSIYLSSFDSRSNPAESVENEEKKGIVEKKLFICHHCCSKWSDYYMIKSHIVWNHIPELENKDVYRIVPNLKNINLVNRIFFKLKEKGRKCKMNFSAFRLRIMFNKRKIKYYKCQHCDFKTPKEYDMRKHKSMKHNQLLHQCTFCNYCTAIQSCLNKHVMAKHTKEKPHKCKFCNYCATQYITLQEHVMAKHTFEKPHQCPHCDYASVQRNMLKDHIKGKHTHEKTRQCPHCCFVSVSSATLRRHVMAKHTNEKPYKCEYCSYSATQSGQLKKHTMAMHTNEKPFHCPHCLYKATQSYSLKIHIRRKHSIDKRYQCSLCEYKSNTNTYLKYHIQNKHNLNLSIENKQKFHSSS